MNIHWAICNILGRLYLFRDPSRNLIKFLYLSSESIAVILVVIAGWVPVCMAAVRPEDRASPAIGCRTLNPFILCTCCKCRLRCTLQDVLHEVLLRRIGMSRTYTFGLLKSSFVLKVYFLPSIFATFFYFTKLYPLLLVCCNVSLLLQPATGLFRTAKIGKLWRNHQERPDAVKNGE